MIDMDVIWRTVAQSCGVPEHLVRSDGKRATAAHNARQVAMALARELTPLTLQEISRHFGLDASSVTWAVRKVNERRALPQFAKQLDRITRQLRRLAEEPAEQPADVPAGAALAVVAGAPATTPAPTPVRSIAAEAEAARIMEAIEYLVSWQPDRLRSVLSRLYGRDQKTGRLTAGPAGEHKTAPSVAATAGGAAAGTSPATAVTSPAGGGRRKRACLSCGEPFQSAGAHNRLCIRCVRSDAAGLPAQFA